MALDARSAASMTGMFRNAANLRLRRIYIRTSARLRSTAYMFSGASAFQGKVLISDTRGVNMMQGMFQRTMLNRAVSLDMSGIAQAVFVRHMFDGCRPGAGVNDRGTLSASAEHALGDRVMRDDAG